MPHPRRLRAVAVLMRLFQRSGVAGFAARVLPGRLGRRLALMPEASASFYAPEAEVLPAVGERRARVGFLSGCAMSLFFADINEATVRVLRRNGCEVVIPHRQACCGALNVHNGEADSARAMARRNIEAFRDDVDAIVVNAAGCGAAMKEYGHLLARDPLYGSRAESFSARVRDVSEFLAALGIRTPARPSSQTVTYQDPCHLAHGQRVRDEPRALLAAAGARLVEMPGSDRCCGSAGIYNVLQPEMAETLLREKMDAIRATGAATVVAPNPGCMIQLKYGAQRFGVSVRVAHLMDLLDEAGA
jgi:glycolate oxidase iron-sulfur subunit